MDTSPKHKFTPNQLGKELFNLKADEYFGDGLTPLLEDTIGEDNYRKYVPAQDPLCGDVTSGDVIIHTNTEETDPVQMEFAAIGTVHEL